MPRLGDAVIGAYRLAPGWYDLGYVLAVGLLAWCLLAAPAPGDPVARLMPFALLWGLAILLLCPKVSRHTRGYLTIGLPLALVASVAVLR